MKKDFLARELTTEVVVGVFVVMVLFAMAYFTFMISGKKLGEKVYPMVVEFENVMGLREKDNVVVRGMPIGEVRRLELLEDAQGNVTKVRVTAEVKKKLSMRKDYKIIIVATSILGGRYLQISEGSERFGTLPMDFCFQGQPPHDLMQDAADLVNDAKDKLTGDQGVVENLRKASDEIRQIAARLNKGEGSLGKLLSDDDQMYQDLKASIASLKTVTDRIEKGKGTLGKLFSEDDVVYQDLRASVASMKKISERLEKGEGVLGKLLSEDETLYDELRETVDEARGALDDLRETTPVVTFTSILFGAF